MDADASVAPFAAAQLGVFTREQALSAGWSRHQLDRRVRQRRVRRAQKGIFVDNSAPRTWDQRVLAAVMGAGAGAAASHLVAAALHGFPDGVREGVEVSVPHDRQARLRGVRVHRVVLTDPDIVRLGPIAATSYARTLVDCSACLSLGQVARALDHGLVERKTSLWAVEQCLLRLEKAPGRRPSVINTLLAERHKENERAESRQEIRVHRVIAAAGLPVPVPQHQVIVEGRRFRLDFAYPERRLAIEYLGFDPHRSRAAFDRDFRRDRLLKAAGWDVLYLTAATTDAEIVDAITALTGFVPKGALCAPQRTNRAGAWGEIVRR